MNPIKNNYYHIKLNNEETIGRFEEDGYWSIIGSDEIFSTDQIIIIKLIELWQH